MCPLHCALAMCGLSYPCLGPALLVLPLFLVSIVNLFVAGPPLKTIVLESSGSSYGASLPFMRLQVAGSVAKFTLSPKDEMTHFFVVTCYADASSSLALDAVVRATGSAYGATGVSTWTPLAHTSTPQRSLVAQTEPAAKQRSRLQLMQPLLGFSQYEVHLKTLPSEPGGSPPNLPAVEYRLTYVPIKFSFTSICVRGFFLVTSTLMFIGFACAIASRASRELGQFWVLTLLVLLIALNDPLYIARIYLGGNHGLYVASVFGQILFSGSLFLFWLVYADGMSSASMERYFCSFYLPKLLLVATYVGVAGAMFVLHGRLPDRINMADGVALEEDGAQFALMVALCASVICVGLWLSVLVSQAVYRLGWKKVEYIYTEREKSFVGITIVFVILSLCGHLYRAVHGRRGSWMQLQLPFLTLTNSYVALLAHAFWPSDGAVAPVEDGVGDGAGGGQGGYADERGRGQSLLDDDDED